MGLSCPSQLRRLYNKLVARKRLFNGLIQREPTVIPEWSDCCSVKSNAPPSSCILSEYMNWQNRNEVWTNPIHQTNTYCSGLFTTGHRNRGRGIASKMTSSGCSTCTKLNLTPVASHLWLHKSTESGDNWHRLIVTLLLKRDVRQHLCSWVDNMDSRKQRSKRH